MRFAELVAEMIDADLVLAEREKARSVAASRSIGRTSKGDRDRPILLTGGTGMVGHNVRDLAADTRHRDRGAAPRGTRSRRLRRDGRAFHAPDAARRSSFMPPGGSAASKRTCASRSRSSPRTGRWGATSSWRRATPACHVCINLGSSCMYPKDNRPPAHRGGYPAGRAARADQRGLCDRQDAPCSGSATTSAPRIRGFQYKTLIPCNLYGRYDTFDPTRSHLAAAVIHKLHHAKARRTDRGRDLGRRQRAPRIPLRRRSRRRDPARQSIASTLCRRS